MSDLYFAYGSNLKTTRMLERIPSAVHHGVATLPGSRVTLDKPGRDGSGKANLTRDADALVWGFVYRLEVADWALLDGFERGYARTSVEVAGPADARIVAQTYVALQPVGGLTAFEWYRALIVEGAREHGFPPDYVERLLSLPIQRSSERTLR